ncbi:MAG: hypothetical protein RL172_1495 [Bacteroidota bacterium]
MKKWTFTILLTNLCLHTAAQLYQHTLYNTTNGLSSNSVSTAVKDARGFLWIATSNGLNRFDGNAFDHFFNNPADSTSIASNEINNLFIDAQQQLWVSTMAGISLYHPRTQTFSNYAPDTLVMPKIGHHFPAIQQDAAGNIWLGGSYDLLVFNPASKKFSSSGWAAFAAKVKPASGNHSRVVILGMQKKSAQEFWVLTTYGLFSVQQQTRQFTYYPYPDISDYFGCQLNYIDEKGLVWIGTYQHGIICFNPAQNKWIRYSTPATLRNNTNWDWAYGITQYHADTLWYCTRKGIVYLVPGQPAFARLPGRPLADSLPAAVYTNIIKEGPYTWLASSQGLTKLHPGKKIFSRLEVPAVTKPGKLYPLQQPHCYILSDDEEGQVYFFNKQTGIKKKLTSSDGKTIKGTLSFKSIGAGKALLATDEQLYWYNEHTAIATPINLPARVQPINPHLLRNIAFNAADSTVWIRDRRQGILQLNSRNNSIHYLSICNTKEQTTFSSMYFDSLTNTLWAGIENQGVYLYNIATQKSTHLLLNIAPSQKGSTFTAITGNKQGTIYASDINYGLFVFNSRTHQYTRYTSYDGLISNNCNFLCADALGNTWLSSAEGVSRFDSATKTFTNFAELKEAANYAAFISADNKGQLYIASPQGFYTWDSHHFFPANTGGRLYLRNCKLADKARAIDSVYNFNHQQNNLSFQFGYLSFEANEPVLLQYQLNNGEWYPLKSDHLLSLSNLSPNHYLLAVREKNNPQQQLYIHFTIRPPFYKSWWFISLLVLAVSSLVYYLFKKRLATIKKQAALKQRMAETEMMALRAQMNPHFIFNCISSIDNFILDNDKINASNYLNKFARLIRSILDNSQNEVVPFWKDWETLKLYLQLEQLRSNNKFTYTLQADDELLNGHYKIPPLIIQPYIENAIHHGLNPLQNRQGLLLVTATLQNNQLLYTIQDNGIGRKKAAEKNSISPSHQSYGMQLTKERINLFNEQTGNNISITDRYDSQHNAAGTQVTVLLYI